MKWSALIACAFLACLHAQEDASGEIYKELEPLYKQRQELDKKISELKAKIPKKPVKDYEFKDADDKAQKLSDLFGDKNLLIVVRNMGAACGLCAVYGDQFAGAMKHLAKRSAFTMVNQDEPEKNKETGKDRNWTFPMLSAKDSTFLKDMGFETEKGGIPGVMVFEKTPKGELFLIRSANFFQGDRISGLLDVLWMLPDEEVNEAAKSNLKTKF